MAQLAALGGFFALNFVPLTNRHDGRQEEATLPHGPAGPLGAQIYRAAPNSLRYAPLKQGARSKFLKSLREARQILRSSPMQKGVNSKEHGSQRMHLASRCREGQALPIFLRHQTCRANTSPPALDRTYTGLKNGRIKLLKLACVNCGAPLEIGPELDVFACSYCGSQQRVERKGGVIELRRVETAIRAVQRGTDRTAAELAMPRLRSELAELQCERRVAVSAAKERLASALLGRRKLTFIVFFVVFLGGPALISATVGQSVVMSFLWLVACVVAPTFVYRKIKLPPDESSVVAVRIDERIGRVTAHLEATRRILDQLPE